MDIHTCAERPWLANLVTYPEGFPRLKKKMPLTHHPTEKVRKSWKSLIRGHWDWRQDKWFPWPIDCTKGFLTVHCNRSFRNREYVHSVVTLLKGKDIPSLDDILAIIISYSSKLSHLRSKTNRIAPTAALPATSPLMRMATQRWSRYFQSETQSSLFW